jgi:hypothetical protein
MTDTTAGRERSGAGRSSRSGARASGSARTRGRARGCWSCSHDSSRSRTSQRRSQPLGALSALTRPRSTMVRSVVSTTRSTAVCPFHSLDAASTRSNSARTSSTEGEGDLLDVAPFALHRHGVVGADGLGEGDLQAGDEVADGGAGRDPGDDPDDPGRGQQAGPGRTGLGEAEPHEGVLGHAHHPHGQPRPGADQRQQQQVEDPAVGDAGQARGGEREQQRGQGDHDARRPAEVGGGPPGPARGRGPSSA